MKGKVAKMLRRAMENTGINPKTHKAAYRALKKQYVEKHLGTRTSHRVS